MRNAGVALITADRQNLEVVAFHSPLPEERSALGMLLPFAGNPSSQEVIRTRKPLVLRDAQTESALNVVEKELVLEQDLTRYRP